MFTMMNNARLSVGLQGVAIAERSYQATCVYAAERIQGKSFQTGERVSIDQHGDVKRMLMTMRAHIESCRALTYEAAIALDAAMKGDKNAQAKVDLLTPIVKAWCTEVAQEVTSLAIQVHGGMGFIEETKVAQYYRDARILPIYEGTNGIQAADLAFRKILHDGAASARNYTNALKTSLGEEYTNELKNLEETIDHVLKLGADKNFDAISVSCMPLLKGFGIIACAAHMHKSISICENKDDPFYKSKKNTAQFYLNNFLPLANAYLDIAKSGYDSVLQ